MENTIENIPLTVSECTVFFSFLRLRCLLPDDLTAIVGAELVRIDRGAGEGASDEVGRAGAEARVAGQQVTLGRAPDDQRPVIEIQALVDRKDFPAGYALAVTLESGRAVVPAADLVALERALHARSSLGEFREIVAGDPRIRRGGRPRLLDIGGRSRSGIAHSREFPDCDVTILDIRPGEGVDVVADIHAMSRVLARESFDLVLCVSVFEHLVMPWKAVLEINHVLRPGGIALIQTHQTVGMHDLPWDYYRFSDACWPGLFNRATGFSIRHTIMAHYSHVVPAHYYAYTPGDENAGGFQESSVVAQKVGPTMLTWPVDLDEIVDTPYPA